MRSTPRHPASAAPAISVEAHETAERFGYEWTRFAEIRPEYEDQMLGWIAPIGRDDFAGRRVLDAGCGKGRHLRLAAAFGAKEVIGVDLGPAVDVAAQNTADLENVHVIQGDLTHPPLRDETHGPDLLDRGAPSHPRARGRVPGACAASRSGGRFVAWLYAREGNGWVLALVDPARRLSSQLPLPLVSALASIITVPLWVALRTLYAPARTRPGLARALPYSSYLMDLVPFPFREVHSIAFDQLLAPVAHYMERAHVERCFAEGRLALESIRWHHANSWAATGNAGSSRTLAHRTVRALERLRPNLSLQDVLEAMLEHGRRRECREMKTLRIVRKIRVGYSTYPIR
jgi:SAM-dependent methyltransferase